MLGFHGELYMLDQARRNNNNNVTDDQVDGDVPRVIEDDTTDDDYGCNLDEMLRHAAPLVQEQARGGLDNWQMKTLRMTSRWVVMINLRCCIRCLNFLS